MRDRERGTRWMNVAHIHAPSGRHGSRSGCMRAARLRVPPFNPRRMPRLFDIRADARRRPRRRVSWRGTDRDDAGMDAGFAAHFRDFASFAHAVWTLVATQILRVVNSA